MTRRQGEAVKNMRGGLLEKIRSRGGQEIVFTADGEEKLEGKAICTGCPTPSHV